MIATIHGCLQAVTHDSVVIETGGIGFLLYVPRPVVASLGAIGDEATLYTRLIVREDSLTLYGFATGEQRTVFDTLLTVSGVGPRVALNVLSVYTPDDLRIAVAHKDAARLARVQGIGKKTAERLLLELNGKLDLVGISVGTSPHTTPETQHINAELHDVLVSLGYSNSEAQAAIASVPADAPPVLEERLTIALRYFGGV